MTRLRAFAVALALGAPACDPGTDPGSTIDRLEIRLTPTRPSYPPGDSVQASVVAFSRDGTWMPAGTPRWRSLQPNIASVTPSGLIRAGARGVATIEVEANGATAQLQVPVRGTLHPGYRLQSNETWRVADTPHVVVSYLGVGGIYGARDTTVLTIEAGSTIRFRPGAGLFFGDIDPAALVIPPGDPVIMEGDSAARGSWVGVSFGGPKRSELRNLTIRHCGAKSPSGNTVPCLAAAATELLIDGVTVSEAHDGVVFTHGVTFADGSRNLSIERTSGHMATISPQVVSTFPRGGHFSDNVENEIRITIGLVERSATWSELGAPLRLTDAVTFAGSGRPRLTLTPGLVLRSDPRGSLSVARLAAGVSGGPPVVLESTGDGWGGIGVGNGSEIRNVILRDCGTTSVACLRVADTGLVVDNVTIQDARSVAVLLDVGAKFGVGSRDLTITGAGDVPIEMRAEAVPSLPPGAYRFNAFDAIRVRWADVWQHETWFNPGVPYVLSEGLTIRSPLSPDSSSLTLAPGVVVQMGVGTQVTAGGALRAVGTPNEPIVFTSVTPGVPGSWVGIVLGGETRPQLEYVDIRDAGAGPNGYGGAVRMSVDPGGVLRNSIIRRSASCGMILYDLIGNPQWTDDYADPAFGNVFIEVAGPAMCQVPA